MEKFEERKARCQCNLHTTLSCNRLILSGSTVILLILNLIVVTQTLSIMNGDVLFTNIYPSARNTGAIVCLSAGLFACNSLFGFFASYYRFRNAVKAFLLFTFLFLIFQVVAIVLVSGLSQPDQLKVRSTEFLDGWTKVIAQIKQGEDTDAKLVAFITEITTFGSCCGYDSTTAEDQNLDTRCSQDNTCDAYLDTYIESQVSSFVTIYTVFLCIGLIDFAALLFFLVRVVPQPVHREDPGGYYYA